MTDVQNKEDQALDERLKAALWYSIGKIVDEETLRLGVNATPHFIGSLTEMVWAQIRKRDNYFYTPLFRSRVAKILALAAENVSQDLESFSRHAGRTVISVDDVMLLARRNESLEAVLRNFLTAQGLGKAKS